MRKSAVEEGFDPGRESLVDGEKCTVAYLFRQERERLNQCLGIASIRTGERRAVEELITQQCGAVAPLVT